MRDIRRLLLALSLAITLAPVDANAGKLGSAIAAPFEAAARKVRGAIASVRNIVPKTQQRFEIAGLNRLAKMGLLRENQLIKLKTRTFHTDKGVQREKILMEVVNGHLEKEVTVTRGAHAQTTYNGNWRRLMKGWGRLVAADVADPDFKASKTDPAAKARFEQRQAERKRIFDESDVPHSFVNTRGERVTLKESKE